MIKNVAPCPACGRTSGVVREPAAGAGPSRAGEWRMARHFALGTRSWCLPGQGHPVPGAAVRRGHSRKVAAGGAAR